MVASLFSSKNRLLLQPANSIRFIITFKASSSPFLGMVTILTSLPRLIMIQ